MAISVEKLTGTAKKEHIYCFNFDWWFSNFEGQITFRPNLGDSFVIRPRIYPSKGGVVDSQEQGNAMLKRKDWMDKAFMKALRSSINPSMQTLKSTLIQYFISKVWTWNIEMFTQIMNILASPVNSHYIVKNGFSK